jgi:hypothetical protein
MTRHLLHFVGDGHSSLSTDFFGVAILSRYLRHVIFKTFQIKFSHVDLLLRDYNPLLSM